MCSFVIWISLAITVGKWIRHRRTRSRFLPEMPQWVYLSLCLPHTHFTQSKQVCLLQLETPIQTVISPPLGFMRYSLQMICPYLSLILKANTHAALQCSTWLRFHFVVGWSMISSLLLCVVFLPEEQRWKCIMWSSNKEGENVLMCFRKSRVTEEWRVFTQGFLIMYICV